MSDPILVTPPPMESPVPYEIPPGGEWSPIPIVTLPPTDAAEGLVIPVADGAIFIPGIVLLFGAIALAMRWIEQRTR